MREFNNYNLYQTSKLAQVVREFDNYNLYQTSKLAHVVREFELQLVPDQ